MIKIISLLNQDEAQAFFGPEDEYARLLEKKLGVKISARPEGLKLSSSSRKQLEKAASVAEKFLQLIRGHHQPDRAELEVLLMSASQRRRHELVHEQDLSSPTRGSLIKEKFGSPKTKGQEEYVLAIKNYDVVFGLGPAGTGKTYLAMAMAVSSLNSGRVRRIILTRPALEAGESLGFLPGDVHEKLSPYLRPLYDALYDMMEAARIEKFIEMGIIEVAPLAYMRGRTLNDAFIILDEAQNCTPEQLKMFLTRIGFDSKAVITGDITQSDLPGGRPIGLIQAQQILSGIEGISFVHLTGADVVRHEIVQRIIEAYEKLKSS